jgi:transcription elongation factor Elf1
MAMAENDLRVLQALATAQEQHQELVELLEFYSDLYEVQFQAKASMAEPSIDGQMAMDRRLEAGIPQLTFDRLELAAKPFAGLALQVAGVLLRHNPTWQLAPEQWAPQELLTLAREVFDTWPTLAEVGTNEGSVNASPLRSRQALSVSFALAPYLQRAAEAILPHLDLTSWGRGTCPICGGRPNLALLEKQRGARQLMCARCDALWSYQRIGCPFCGSKEKQVYYPSKDEVYRLYVCPDCHQYLKTVDLRGVYREVHPRVERLLTVGMDLAVQREGSGISD